MSVVYSFLRHGSGSWREEESTGPDSAYGSVNALAAALSVSDVYNDRSVQDVGDEASSSGQHNDSSSSSSSGSGSTSSCSSDDSSDDSDDDDEDCGSSQSHHSGSWMAASGVEDPNGEIPSMFGSNTNVPRTPQSRRRLSSSDNAPLDTSLMQLSGMQRSPGGSVQFDATRVDSERRWSLRGATINHTASSRRNRMTEPLRSSLMLDNTDTMHSPHAMLEQDSAITAAGERGGGSPMPAVLTPTRLPSAPSRRLSGTKTAPTQSVSPNNPERQLSGTYRNPSGRGDIYGRLSSLKSARILLHGGNTAWKGAPNMQNFTNNEAVLWASMQQNRQAGAVVTPETLPPSSSTSGTGSASRRARLSVGGGGESTERSRVAAAAAAAHHVQVFRGDFDNDASLDSVQMAAVQARERGSGGPGHDGMPSFVTNELTHSILDGSVNTGATTFRLLTFEKQDDGPMPPRPEHRKKKKDPKDKKDKKDKKTKKHSSKKDKTTKPSKTQDEAQKAGDDLANGDLVAPATPATLVPQPPSPATLARESGRRTTLPGATAVSPLSPSPNPSSPGALSTETPPPLRQAASMDGVEELNARNAASRRREAQEAHRRSTITRPAAVPRLNTPVPKNPATTRARSATETQDRRPGFVGAHKTSDRIKVYTQPPSASPSATLRRTTVRPKPVPVGKAGSRSGSAVGLKKTALPPLGKP